MNPEMKYWDGSEWSKLEFRNFNCNIEHGRATVLDAVVSRKHYDDLSHGTEVSAFLDNERIFVGELQGGGKLNRDGSYEIEALGYGKKARMTKVNIEADSDNDNLDIMEEMVEDIEYRKEDGSIDTFSLNRDGVVEEEAINLPNYSIKNEKGSHLIKELVDEIGWQLWFDEDGTVYYEPFGLRESGESIDTGEDNVNIRSFTPEIPDSVISEVRVIGEDEDGELVGYNYEVEDPDEERFEKIRLDFIIDEDTAEKIGMNHLNPEATDEAEIILPIQQLDTDPSDVLFNKTIGFNDDTRTDGFETFVVWKKSINEGGALNLTLETAPRFDWYDVDFNKKEDIKDERSHFISADEEEHDHDSGDLDTGNSLADVYQSGTVVLGPSNTTISGDISLAPSDTSISGSVDDDESDTSISGSTDFHEVFQYPSHAMAQIGSGETHSSSLKVGFYVPDDPDWDIPVLYQGVVMQVTFMNNNDESFSGTLTVDNDTDNTELYSTSVSVSSESWGETVLIFDHTEVEEGDLLYAEIDPDSGNEFASPLVVNTYMDVVMDTFSIHRHDDSYSTTDDDHGHGDDFSTVDDDHDHDDDFSTKDEDHGHEDTFSVEEPEDGHNDHGVEGDVGATLTTVADVEKDNR